MQIIPDPDSQHGINIRYLYLGRSSIHLSSGPLTKPEDSKNLRVNHAP
jgi:hypothetical protein